MTTVDEQRERVTAVLAAAVDGKEAERLALDRLVPLVYDELCRMARAQLAAERHRLTLDTGALVHEAYVKLVDAERVPVQNRAYFFGAAARAMRQVLIDAARRRLRGKRGGGQPAAALDVEAVAVDALAEEMLAIDEALQGLSAEHPRAARALEYRYFGGLGVKEIASALGLGARSVNRDLALAMAWMRRELGGSKPPR